VLEQHCVRPTHNAEFAVARLFGPLWWFLLLLLPPAANDKSFVPGYSAMSGHTYMILLMPLSLFDCKCAPHIRASRMKRPWSLLPHNMAAKHTLE
jgi:hypothetical protein